MCIKKAYHYTCMKSIECCKKGSPEKKTKLNYTATIIITKYYCVTNFLAVFAEKLYVTIKTIFKNRHFVRNTHNKNCTK